MALFQPIQPGPSGSAVTPKAEVQNNVTSNTLNVVGNMANTIGGVFQQQTKAKNEAAAGVAMTAFVEEQSRIAEAAEQGQLTPAEAHTRMRAVFNKHAANNPLLLNPLLEVQKSYAESQMGQSVDKGSLEYQKKQALDIQLSKEALSAGFTDVNKYLSFRQDQVEWKRNDERRSQQLFLATMEQKRAATDASRQSAAASRVQRLLAEEKQHHNEGLRTELSGVVAGAQDGLSVILQSPLTQEAKADKVRATIAQWKADGAGRYSKAEQGNLNMYNTALDTLEKNFIDSITRGTVTELTKNNLSMLQDKAMIAVLSKGKNALTAATINAFGEGFYNSLPAEQLEEIGKTVQTTEMPVDVKGDYQKFNTGNFELFFRSANAQAKNMGSTGTPEADKQNMQNQANNIMETISLFDDHSTKEEKEAGIKSVTATYEMLKTAGSFDIEPAIRGRYQNYMQKNFREVEAQIRNDYFDEVDIAFKTTGSGITTGVKAEVRNAVDVIKPVIQNGVFKFVASDKSAQAQANKLNKSLAPGVNTLLKLIAVANGNPDLNEAMKELEPRLFHGEITEE